MNEKYKIAIIGGKLQGTEAVYLAREAGFYTILFDRRESVPASKLCDEFICCDICTSDSRVLDKLFCADIILPAMENINTINYLEQLKVDRNAKIAFDFHAYSISSSKRKSDRLFQNHGISAPEYYPYSSPPYVVKPSSESGSIGVMILDTAYEVEKFLSNIESKEEWVIQEQLQGPSYSVEIIGEPGNYRTYQITEIHMDKFYDCNRVSCPCNITETQKQCFENMAFTIAEIVGLHGIMDLEVIDHNGVFKILEIDARIPSQTPTAVYHSTGINLLSELVDLFEGRWNERTGHFPLNSHKERFVSYEHHCVLDNRLQSLGENIMGNAGPLSLYKSYLGSDEVITDYCKGDIEFRGTFINSGSTINELGKKRARMFTELVMNCPLLDKR